ncbi:MAG: UbiA family prenyltransferase [Methanophagales archaeon]|nr:UbiA family prenyltransferase [Methanophagales archaeon]
MAINGALKLLFSCLLFNTFTLTIILAIFLATYGVYGLNKLTDLKEDIINAPERARLIKKIAPVFKLSVLFAFILSLLLGFLVNLLTLPILLLPLFSGTLYSVKFSKNLPRLKDMLGVKNMTIALTWAVTMALLPVFCLVEKDIVLIITIFYFFFLKSLINTILFDVRDIEGDRTSGVRTIPVVWGRQKTKNLLLILNSTLIPWLAFSYHSGFFHHYLVVLIFAIGYGYWYILQFCKLEKIGESLDVLVDGEWIPVVILATAFTLF